MCDLDASNERVRGSGSVPALSSINGFLRRRRRSDRGPLHAGSGSLASTCFVVSLMVIAGVDSGRFDHQTLIQNPTHEAIEVDVRGETLKIRAHDNTIINLRGECAPAEPLVARDSDGNVVARPTEAVRVLGGHRQPKRLTCAVWGGQAVARVLDRGTAGRSAADRTSPVPISAACAAVRYPALSAPWLPNLSAGVADVCP